MRTKGVLTSLGAMLLLTGCPSGKSIRGVEHEGTKRPVAQCPGHEVKAWTAPGLCVTRFE